MTLPDAARCSCCGRGHADVSCDVHPPHFCGACGHITKGPLAEHQCPGKALVSRRLRAASSDADALKCPKLREMALEASLQAYDARVKRLAQLVVMPTGRRAAPTATPPPMTPTAAAPFPVLIPPMVQATVPCGRCRRRVDKGHLAEHRARCPPEIVAGAMQWLETWSDRSEAITESCDNMYWVVIRTVEHLPRCPSVESHSDGPSTVRAVKRWLLDARPLVTAWEHRLKSGNGPPEGRKRGCLPPTPAASTSHRNVSLKELPPDVVRLARLVCDGAVSVTEAANFDDASMLFRPNRHVQRTPVSKSTES